MGWVAYLPRQRQFALKIEDTPIRFNTPTRMGLNETTSIVLVINPRGADEPLPTITAPGEQTETTISTTCSTTATLTGPRDVFDIVAATEPTQGLCRNQTGTWTWSVTALRTGTHQLKLAITANFPGEDPSTVEVFSEGINIQVSPISLVSGFIGRNIGVLVAAFLGAIGAAVGAGTWSRVIRSRDED